MLPLDYLEPINPPTLLELDRALTSSYEQLFEQLTTYLAARHLRATLKQYGVTESLAAYCTPHQLSMATEKFMDLVNNLKNSSGAVMLKQKLFMKTIMLRAKKAYHDYLAICEQLKQHPQSITTCLGGDNPQEIIDRIDKTVEVYNKDAKAQVKDAISTASKMLKQHDVPMTHRIMNDQLPDNVSYGNAGKEIDADMSLSSFLGPTISSIKKDYAKKHTITSEQFIKLKPLMGKLMVESVGLLLTILKKLFLILDNYTKKHGTEVNKRYLYTQRMCLEYFNHFTRLQVTLFEQELQKIKAQLK